MQNETSCSLVVYRALCRRQYASRIYFDADIAFISFNKFDPERPAIMTRSKRTLRPLTRIVLMLGALASSYATLSHADDGLLRCRAIADATQRLACYDALPATAGRASGAGSSSASGTAKAAAPTAASAAAGAAAVGNAPTAAAPNRVEEFGLEEKRAAANQLNTIESSIGGRFEGWGPGSRITLANGQVWRVMDDSSATLYLNNPKVQVRRGMLGAFYLEIDGTNRSPKVKRVQ